MQSSRLWLALLPFAAFAAAFCVGAVALWYLAKRTKISQTETKYGKAIHVDSPIGTLETHPEATMDPRLATIPVYPGAMRENPMEADSVAELHIGSREWREVSARYWTPDSTAQVWQFYRQQLPDWPQNLDGTQGGQELINDGVDCVLLVQVSRSGERTLIATCVKPPGYPHPFERGYSRRK